MNRPRPLVIACAVAALAAAAALAACGGESDSSGAPSAAALVSEVADAPSRTLGFVLVDFSFEQPARPANACPAGWNLNERDLRVEELSTTDPEAASRVLAGFAFIRKRRERGGPDPCKEPEKFNAEPHHLVQGLEVAPGFDLDGVVSTRDAPGPAACPHDDLRGLAGELGIDNQLWGALGCISGYERGATIDEFAIGNIREGQRTILVRISGVDDARNDDQVELGFFTSPDAIPADAAGVLMSGASLSISSDARYQNVMDARIVDGIVTAGPSDLRLDFKGQFLDSEYLFRDARVRLEILDDGSLRGLLGGYWDIESFYDAYARQATRLGAFTVGFRCPGIYGALRRRADAYPDAETGQCTAVSTAFRLAGIPAFVIDPESESESESESASEPEPEAEPEVLASVEVAP
jgi:hypothetical protein